MKPYFGYAAAGIVCGLGTVYLSLVFDRWISLGAAAAIGVLAVIFDVAISRKTGGRSSVALSLFALIIGMVIGEMIYITLIPLKTGFDAGSIVYTVSISWFPSMAAVGIGAVCVAMLVRKIVAD